LIVLAHIEWNPTDITSPIFTISLLSQSFYLAQTKFIEWFSYLKIPGKPPPSWCYLILYFLIFVVYPLTPMTKPKSFKVIQTFFSNTSSSVVHSSGVFCFTAYYKNECLIFFSWIHIYFNFEDSWMWKEQQDFTDCTFKNMNSKCGRPPPKKFWDKVLWILKVLNTQWTSGYELVKENLCHFIVWSQLLIG